jgi:dnd system-associated protein 4
MRDVLVFAAAIGLSRGSRASFSQRAGDDITLETMRGNLNFKLVCEVIQVAISDGSANCLAHEHDDDALTAFEEYACGGLNLLEEALADIPKPHGPREFRSLITNFVVNDLTSGKIRLLSQGANTL